MRGVVKEMKVVTRKEKSKGHDRMRHGRMLLLLLVSLAGGNAAPDMHTGTAARKPRGKTTGPRRSLLQKESRLYTLFLIAQWE